MHVEHLKPYNERSGPPEPLQESVDSASEVDLDDTLDIARLLKEIPAQPVAAMSEATANQSDVTFPPLETGSVHDSLRPDSPPVRPQRMRKPTEPPEYDYNFFMLFTENMTSSWIRMRLEGNQPSTSATTEQGLGQPDTRPLTERFSLSAEE